MTATQIQKMVDRLIRQGPDAMLTKGQATALIAHRTVKEPNEVRKARNRIGLRMVRSSEKSDDVTRGGLRWASTGRITCDEIKRWTAPRFPGKFDDLPHKPRNLYEHVKAGAAATDSTALEEMPGDVGGLQALVAELRATIKQMLDQKKRDEEDWKKALVARLHSKKFH